MQKWPAEVRTPVSSDWRDIPNGNSSSLIRRRWIGPDHFVSCQGYFPVKLKSRKDQLIASPKAFNLDLL